MVQVADVLDGRRGMYSVLSCRILFGVWDILYDKHAWRKELTVVFGRWALVFWPPFLILDWSIHFSVDLMILLTFERIMGIRLPSTTS